MTAGTRRCCFTSARAPSPTPRSSAIPRARRKPRFSPQSGSVWLRSPISVFAYKGESLDEYWEFTHKIFEWHGGAGKFANMILDDGGDATLLLHLGTRAESDPAVIGHPASEEETALFAAIRKRLAAQPDLGVRLQGRIARRILGVHPQDLRVARRRRQVRQHDPG